MGKRQRFALLPFPFKRGDWHGQDNTGFQWRVCDNCNKHYRLSLMEENASVQLGDLNGNDKQIHWGFVFAANERLDCKDKQTTKKHRCTVFRNQGKEVIKMEDERFRDDFEEDLYNEAYLEESMDNDEIDSVEEGFMIGYTRAWLKWKQC